MRKSELVAATAKKANLTQKEVEAVLDAMCEVIETTVMDNNEEVLLPLGKFKKKVNPARTGINPLTKKEIEVAETHNLAFKPTKSLKRVIDAQPKKKASKKK